MSQTMSVVELPDYVYQRNDFGVQSPFPSGATPRQLLQIDHPPGEGFLCYFSGLNYPVRGFMDYRVMEKCNALKKYIRSWLRVFSHPKAVPFVLLGALFFPITKHVVKKWIEEFAAFSQEQLGRHQKYIDRKWFYEEEFYTPFVKELHRVAIKLWGHLPFATILIDTICTILENDRPYRYWLMDILSTSQRARWIAWPAKELKDTLQKLVERCHARNWKKEKALFTFLAYISPSLRRELRAWATEMDFSVCRLDDKDLFFLLQNPEYDTGGLKADMRKIRWELIAEKPAVLPIGA